VITPVVVGELTSPTPTEVAEVVSPGIPSASRPGREIHLVYSRRGRRTTQSDLDGATMGTVTHRIDEPTHKLKRARVSTSFEIGESSRAPVDRSVSGEPLECSISALAFRCIWFEQQI
jgi:hypothetical protein